MEKAKTDKNRRVLCWSCDKPIHIKEWGGAVNIDGQEALFHDNVFCLMAVNDRVKLND